MLQCCSDQMVMFTGAAPALIAPSVTYLKIRAWSAPAVLISMVAQVGASALFLCNTPNYVTIVLPSYVMLRCAITCLLHAIKLYHTPSVSVAHTEAGLLQWTYCTTASFVLRQQNFKLECWIATFALHLSAAVHSLLTGLSCYRQACWPNRMPSHPSSGLRFSPS